MGTTLLSHLVEQCYALLSSAESVLGYSWEDAMRFRLLKENGKRGRLVMWVVLRNSVIFGTLTLRQFAYISILNQASGRTRSDVTQYPVFRLS